MKILSIVKSYADKVRGGGETYLHFFLCEMLQKYKEQVKISVLCPNCTQISGGELDGIKVHRTNELHYLQYINEVDLVITQLDEAPKTIEYCLSINKPVIFIIHNHIKAYFKYTKNPNVFVVYNCYDMLKKYQVGDNVNDNYCVVNPYTDFNFYKNQFLNIKDRDYITFINPLRRKGADVFLRLCEYFKDKKFLVVKGGYYHEAQKEYIEAFRRLPNVFVLENQTYDKMVEVYKKSRLVIQPSRSHETYGMVAVEAISCGIPVIVSRMSWAYGNLGKMALYGDTPRCYSGDHEQDATLEEVQEYIDCIKLLDNKPTYLLWSNHYFDMAEKKFYEQKEMMNKYLCLFENKYLNKYI